MEVVANNYLPGDQHLVEKIVYELKAQGIFDQFRKECFADVDTKPAYQNLRQRVEGSVTGFLKEQSWRPDMNKNQVREMLRKTITESGYLETGVERIVDQVVNPKINSVFLPKVEEVVYNYLGIKKPMKNEPSKSDQSDLLPNDLEAVSPESEPIDKKDDKSSDNLQDLDESNKTEEDESPPFEPLEEQSVYVPHEENSVDSHLSGFSGLISHESNQSNENKITPMEQDSQMSRNSSDSRLSIVTSDENSKMEVCEDSQSKSVKTNDPNHKNDDKSKQKLSDKHRSRSESKSEKSDRDRKSSKDAKQRHSSSAKDAKDKEKSRDRKDSKSTSSNNKDKLKDKYDKDRKSSGHSSSKHSSYSSTSSTSSSKDRSSKKDSLKTEKDKDKDKSRSSNSHKDSKPRDKSKDKSSQFDKHKHSSSSHSDRHKKDNKDKKKDAKSKDDHYSSRDKKNDRRSTDRDSNDGQSKQNSSSSSSTENNHGQSQKNGQDSNNGGGDSVNSDHNENTTKAPVVITGAVENFEVTISPPETQRVKVLKPKCASNIQEALRLRKIRKQLAKLEKQNQLSLASVDVSSSVLLSSSIDLDDLDNVKIKQENNKIVSELEVVPSPLQNTVISQDNWDAMEAKLREEVYSEFKEYDSFDDSMEEKPATEEPKQEEIIEDDKCLYFDNVDISKIEFLIFVGNFIKKVETLRNHYKRTGLKRKLVDNDLKNNNKQLKTVAEKKTKLIKKKESEVTTNEKFPLPLSPAESDKSVGKKDDSTTTAAVRTKRNSMNKVNNQRYSSDDLYKPRPTFASSRRRGAKNLDN